MENVEKFPVGSSSSCVHRIQEEKKEGNKFWAEVNEKTPLIKCPDEPEMETSCFRWKKLKFVEPLPVVYFMSMALLDPVLNQYVYLRISEYYGNNGTNTSASGELNQLCNVNKSSPEHQIQQKTQNASSQFLMYLTFIQVFVSIFPTIIIGSIVDRYGRKVALYLTFFTRLFYTGCLLVVVAFKLSIYFLFVGAFLDGLSGSISTAVLAFSSYIADVTVSGRERGFRMTVLECLMGITMGIGFFMSGVLIGNTTFVVPVLVGLALYSFGLIYLRFFLAESYTIPKDFEEKKKMNVLKRTFAFYFQDTPEKRRSRLILGLTGLFFTVPTVSATGSVLMLYILNLPFCWSPERIGIFIAIVTVVHCFLSIAFVKVMQPYMSDIIMAILGNISNLIYYIALAFSTNNNSLYVAAALGAISSVSLPTLRSAMSKLAKQDEQGSLFAGMSFVDMLSTTFFIIIFNTIYSLTLHIMPGLVFFVMSAVMVFAIISFIAFESIARKKEKSQQKEILEN